MKRLIISMIAVLASAGAAIAANWSIRDIEVRVLLSRDGSALVREKWDMNANEGTEVYIPRENLGDIEISDFRVSDETGTQYDFRERWDTDRSLRAKAGECGFNRTGRGVELCWGIGSYGDHIYNIQYRMSNVVKSLNDYDVFHMQLVNSRMAAAPAHVKVIIENPDRQIDTTWVRMWGFGYNGNTSINSNGTVVLESTEHFSYYSSVIALLRFEKGFFESQSVEDRVFQEVFDKAMQGANFGEEEEDEDDWLAALISFITTVGLMLFFVIGPLMSAARGNKLTRRQKRKLLGADPSKLPWWRDVPLGGNIYEADYILDTLEEKREPNAIASALILRMIQNRYLHVRKDEKGKVEILFNESADIEKLDVASRGLFSMMKEASGADIILQDKEFSRWSVKSRNKARIRAWANVIQQDAKAGLNAKDLYHGRKFTPAGQTEAQHLLGLKRYLKDYTIINERHSEEVALWQDYMVFAALFGIADKVAKELKDVNPEVFEQVVPFDSTTYYDVIRMTNSLARSITNARYVPPAAPVTSTQSYGGFGGHSSFGGGGGFHGGGFGGGVR